MFRPMPLLSRAGSSVRPIRGSCRANIPGIEARADQVLSLAQAVEDLYGKMDNSLRFPGEPPQSPAKTPAIEKPQAAPFVSRDFRGVACPMNFVKTKLALEGLTSGQRLKILLDDGAPIQNMPRSVSEEGHKIIEQLREGTHWVVLIEKQ